MSTVLRLSCCLLVAATLVACNKSEPAAPAAAPAAPASTASVTAAPVEPAPTQATADATHVALSMDKVRTYVQALKNLAAAHKADPAVDSAQDLSEEDNAKYRARLQADPKIRAAIEAAGMSTVEFADINAALIGAMMAQAALEAGQLKTLPEDVDPAAVEFVKQHKAELQALMGSGEAG